VVATVEGEPMKIEDVVLIAIGAVLVFALVAPLGVR
jgi:hypothetical protein